MLSASFVISAAHPSLPGHFPGYPITPGVITLDHVVRGLTGQLPGACLDGFPQVKFLRPLPPGIELTVTYNLKSEVLYQFNCENNGEVYLSGQIRLAIGDR